MTEFTQKNNFASTGVHAYDSGKSHIWTIRPQRHGDVVELDSLIFGLDNTCYDPNDIFKKMSMSKHGDQSKIILQSGGTNFFEISFLDLMMLQKVSGRECFIISRDDYLNQFVPYKLKDRVEYAKEVLYENMLVIPLCMNLLMKNICLLALQSHEVRLTVQFEGTEELRGFGLYSKYGIPKIPTRGKNMLETNFGRRILATMTPQLIKYFKLPTDVEHSEIPVVQNYLTTTTTKYSPDSDGVVKVRGWNKPVLFTTITLLNREFKLRDGLVGYTPPQSQNQEQEQNLPQIELLYGGGKPMKLANTGDCCVRANGQKTYVLLGNKYLLDGEDVLKLMKNHLVEESNVYQIFERDPTEMYHVKTPKHNEFKFTMIKFAKTSAMYDVCITHWYMKKLVYYDGMSEMANLYSGTVKPWEESKSKSKSNPTPKNETVIAEE